jgi:integration host factor subunit beta
MTKSELIETVANKLKLPKGKAELIVNCVFDSMEASLKRGERIEIRGFGSFEIRNYKAYEGRNPRTGAKVQVRPKRLPFFKVGKELKERVNNGRLGEDGPESESASQAAPFEPREPEPREEAVGAGTSSDEPPATPPSEPPDGQTPLF